MLFPLLVLISGCATVSPSASPEKVKAALELKPDQYFANLYIRREFALSLAGRGMNVQINNQQIGWLGTSSYFHVKLAPGTYDFIVGSVEVKNATRFNYKFEPNEVVLINCEFDAGSYSGKNIIGSGFAQKSYRWFVNPCWKVKGIDDIRKTLIDSKLVIATPEIIAPSGYLDYAKTREQNTVQAYQQFLSTNRHSTYASEAHKHLQALLQEEKESKHKAAWGTLVNQQQCSLRHDNWVYTGNACQNGLANGVGRATYSDLRTSFNGTIRDGVFISGQYLRDNQVEFEGAYQNGQPEGKGLCAYKGNMEPCTLINGQRTDELFLARQEYEKLLSKQRSCEMHEGMLRSSIESLNTLANDNSCSDKYSDYSSHQIGGRYDYDDVNRCTSDTIDEAKDGYNSVRQYVDTLQNDQCSDYATLSEAVNIAAEIKNAIVDTMRDISSAARQTRDNYDNARRQREHAQQQDLAQHIMKGLNRISQNQRQRQQDFMNNLNRNINAANNFKKQQINTNRFNNSPQLSRAEQSHVTQMNQRFDRLRQQCQQDGNRWDDSVKACYQLKKETQASPEKKQKEAPGKDEAFYDITLESENSFPSLQHVAIDTATKSGYLKLGRKCRDEGWRGATKMEMVPLSQKCREEGSNEKYRWICRVVVKGVCQGK